MKKYRLVLILIFSLVMLAITPYELATASTNLSPAQSPSISASDVIAAINNYRVANGLPALTTNSLLNSLAQTQANYQASIETVTHTGPDGSSAQERASAAGYGDSSGFYFSEIIYGGYNATASDAMTWWKNSYEHNYYILQAYYVEIGAGVATSGNMTYFTAELGGSYSDSPSTGSSTSVSSSSTSESSIITPQAVIIPVQKSTPNADGSIYHIVQDGQTLWTIAAVYNIELDALLELNNMNTYDYVFPGDEIMIQAPGTVPTATATPVEAETDETPGTTKSSGGVIGTAVAYGEQPEYTNTPIVIKVPTKEVENPTTQNESDGIFSENKAIQIIVIIAFICLVVVIVGSIFLQNPTSQDQE